MTDGIVTGDQIGAGDSAVYGADVGPAGGQDMFAFDGIAGAFPARPRDEDPGAFTGGTGGAGLGGEAEGLAPGGTGPGNTLYQRRGF